jgi:hypothetical protein
MAVEVRRDDAGWHQGGAEPGRGQQRCGGGLSGANRRVGLESGCGAGVVEELGEAVVACWPWQ